MATLKFNPDGQLADIWYVRKGSTFRMKYIWMSGAEGQEVPVDFTGWSARGGMYQKSLTGGPPTVLVHLGTDNGRVTLGTDGSISIEVDAATTEAIVPKSGVFDLELVAPNESFVKNFVGGKVKFLTDYTL